jgi:hypothetical protein
MAAIDDAIAAIELREPGEHFSYRAIATQFGVDCTTLSRRHRGCQTSQEAQRTQQQKLNPQQEEELVRYIEDLTKRALPPTREMIGRERRLGELLCPTPQPSSRLKMELWN